MMVTGWATSVTPTMIMMVLLTYPTIAPWCITLIKRIPTRMEWEMYVTVIEM